MRLPGQGHRRAWRSPAHTSDLCSQELRRGDQECEAYPGYPAFKASPRLLSKKKFPGPNRGLVLRD